MLGLLIKMSLYPRQDVMANSQYLTHNLISQRMQIVSLPGTWMSLTSQKHSCPGNSLDNTKIFLHLYK